MLHVKIKIVSTPTVKSFKRATLLSCSGVDNALDLFGSAKFDHLNSTRHLYPVGDSPINSFNCLTSYQLRARRGRGMMRGDSVESSRIIVTTVSSRCYLLLI